MGLFDNLFLDKNTPMMINNGEEHPVIVQKPVTQASAAESAKKEQAISNAETAIGKADTVAELFAPEKPKISMEDEAIVPIKDDIHFSSAINAPTASTNSSEPSFDIGGDISFDIGGDMGLSFSSPSTDPVSVIADTGEQTSSESESTAEVSIDSTSPISILTSLELDTKNDLPPEQSIATQEIGSSNPVKIDDSPNDSVLFTLLNEPASDSKAQNEELPIPVSETVEPINSPIVSMESPISFSPILPDINPIIMPDVTKDTTDITFHSIEEMPTTQDHNDNNGEGSHSYGNAESKFNAKIKGFIEELRNLEAEDQKEREEKMSQAELFRSHAKTLREEAELRAHALEEEAEELVRQADSIAADKAHINSVISNFRDKFSVV